MFRDILQSLLLIHLSMLYFVHLDEVSNLLDFEKESSYTLGLVLLLLGNVSIGRPWMLPLLLPKLSVVPNADLPSR